MRAKNASNSSEASSRKATTSREAAATTMEISVIASRKAVCSVRADRSSSGRAKLAAPITSTGTSQPSRRGKCAVSRSRSLATRRANALRCHHAEARNATTGNRKPRSDTSPSTRGKLLSEKNANRVA